MLKKSSYRKIDAKIYLVFIAVIAIAIFNAVFCSYTILQSKNTTRNIIENKLPSKDALSQLNLLVIKSEMLITGWVYYPSNTSGKLQLKSVNRSEYPALKLRLLKLMDEWDDAKLRNDVKQLLLEFEQITHYQNEITSILGDFDDYQVPQNLFAAEEILETQIIPRSQAMEKKLHTILSMQSLQAKSVQDGILRQLNMLIIAVFCIALLIIGSLFFAAFVISRSFIVPVLRVREIITEMQEGKLPEYNMKVPRNAVGEMLVSLKSLIESAKSMVTFAEEIGKGNLDAEFRPRGDSDAHGHALLKMRNSLKAASKAETERQWINDGIGRLNNIMRSNHDDFNQLLNNIIEMLVEYIGVQQAAIFLLNNDDMVDMHIQLGAHYGLNNKILNSKRYELKEGLVGEALVSNRTIDVENISDPFFTIDMGIRECNHYSLMIVPLATSGRVVGAITVAGVNTFNAQQKDLLARIAEPVAASLFSVRSNLITTQLLEESRKQTDELALQEQELRKINNQLIEKSMMLSVSEEELRSGQLELQSVNEKLHQKARLLEEKNIAIEQARQSLEFKARQLEQSNKYKSAFLANMSHELRTPLNSILILARMLAENKNNALNKKQVEHANIIYKSGSDLLMLINDILDLSKIEAGKVDLQMEDFTIGTLADDMYMLFNEIAKDKKIQFSAQFDIERQCTINNDKMRVQQILKNLISNALKFTSEGGSVTLTFSKSEDDVNFSNEALKGCDNVLAIEVSDNGIGIPEEKQSAIFEAFQQADNSTSRKYGGTGLGLSICKELALLLKGEIQLKSAAGKGSSFTLYLPANTLEVSGSAEDELLRDDKNNLQPGDKRILIIEDDCIYAKMLVYHCHLHGVKAVVALRGDTGLQYARTYKPDAIILDMHLPGIDGSTLLKMLKTDSSLCRIPVHVLTSDEEGEVPMRLGATTFNSKENVNSTLDNLVGEISAEVKSHKSRLLVINGIGAVKSASHIYNVEHATAENCLSRLEKQTSYDYILANDQTSASLKAKLEEESSKLNIPLMYFHQSPDECLRELKKEKAGMQNPGLKTKQFIESLTYRNENDMASAFSHELEGKTVLAVDDDVRNIYSITSSLESEGMTLHCAMNGKEALEILALHPEIEIVLMDIMMPGMNGYDTIREIRKKPEHARLPIIAVTAKAMQEDKMECLNAGADGYCTKPVNTIELLATMSSLIHNKK